jgi:hypothetical protein
MPTVATSSTVTPQFSNPTVSAASRARSASGPNMSSTFRSSAGAASRRTPAPGAVDRVGQSDDPLQLLRFGEPAVGVGQVDLREGGLEPADAQPVLVEQGAQPRQFVGVEPLGGLAEDAAAQVGRPRAPTT